MTFEFKNAAGKTCCKTDNPTHLCAKCKTKLARKESPMKTINPNCPIHGTQARAAAENFTPPDPYKAPLEQLRKQDAARTKAPIAPPTTMPLDQHGVPDPYFNDLQKLRSNR